MNLWIHRADFVAFIVKVDQIYGKLVSLQDSEIKKSVEKHTRYARGLTKLILSGSVVSAGTYYIFPLMLGRILPNPIWIPGINVVASPVYEMLYAVEVCFGILVRKSILINSTACYNHSC